MPLLGSSARCCALSFLGFRGCALIGVLIIRGSRLPELSCRSGARDRSFFIWISLPLRLLPCCCSILAQDDGGRVDEVLSRPA